MQGQENWIGTECEGRLHGLKTLFVRNQFKNPPSDCHHVYFTREFLCYEKNILFLENYLLHTTKCVTIECNNETYKLLTPNMKVRAHIIYRIEDASIHKLKPTDEIMIDAETFNVLCYTKLNGMEVSYADYVSDSTTKRK